MDVPVFYIENIFTSHMDVPALLLTIFILNQAGSHYIKSHHVSIQISRIKSG